MTGLTQLWRYGYDAAGNVTASYDPLNQLTTYGYDVLDRNTVMTVAAGTAAAQTVQQFFDVRDRVYQVVDGTGRPTWLGYDALDRVVQVIDAQGRRSTTAYDLAGRMTWSADALGNVTRYGYDLLGRQTAIMDARGGVTQLGYDLAGNLVALTDSEHNTTRWRYDLLGREVERIDPLGKSTFTTYDLANRVSSIADRLGRRREFDYDDAHRLEHEYWYSPSNDLVNTLSYGYDEASNLLTASDNNGTYTFSNYDELNRPQTKQDIWGLTLTFGYNGLYRTSVTDSLGGTIGSVYDEASRLTQRTFDDGTTPLRIDLGFNARNELTSQTRYSDLDGTMLVGTSTWGYDEVGNLTDLHHRDAAGATISHYLNTFDELNRITSEQYNGQTPINYSYDAISQLTADGTQNYSYDLNGNRTLEGYDTDPGNRLRTDGTWNYDYDDEGNTVKKTHIATGETWTYGYDHRNQMVWAEKRETDGGTLLLRADYRYDVFGRRIEKAVDWDGEGEGGAAVTRFAYDGLDQWAELDGGSSLTMRRLYLDGVDALFARVDANGTAAWYLPDRLGSVRDIVDETGAQNHLDYDGFGNVVLETNPSLGDRYGWTSREFDAETGLQYNRARYYDPLTGHWTSEDPSGFGAGDPNLNRYVGNGPTNATDPLGLQRRVQTLTGRDRVDQDYWKKKPIVPPDVTVIRIKPEHQLGTTVSPPSPKVQIEQAARERALRGLTPAEQTLADSLADLVGRFFRGLGRSFVAFQEAVRADQERRTGNPDVDAIRGTYELGKMIINLPDAVGKAIEAFKNDPVEATG